MHPRTGRSVNSNKIGHSAKVFATWLKLVLQMCVRHFVFCAESISDFKGCDFEFKLQCKLFH